MAGRVLLDVLDLLKPFGAGLATFLTLDLLWIGVVANAFYKRELAGLARMDGENFAIRLGPALVLYPLIILGLQLFVLPRAGGQPLQAALWGGLFGLIGYGVYDLTNYATLRDWPVRLVVIDIAWGGVVGGVTTAVVSLVARRLPVS